MPIFYVNAVNSRWRTIHLRGTLTVEGVKPADLNSLAHLFAADHLFFIRGQPHPIRDVILEDARSSAFSFQRNFALTLFNHRVIMTAFSRTCVLCFERHE
jgi:hypothetical protein